MMKEDIEFDKMEDAKFEIEKEAFRPKSVTCSNCNSKIKKNEIEISIGDSVSVRAFGFECGKCKKRYLGLEESRKLDKGLILSRLLRENFKIERSISFDGDNWTMRIPKEFSQNVQKKKAEIIPLGGKQFCVSIE